MAAREHLARRIDEILRRAAEVGPRERHTFFESACAGDSELLAAVRRAATAGDTGMHEGFAEPGPDPFDSSRAPGEQIGPYRIMRLLGRGGMGEVYLCERADAHFEKEVAIKLVSRDLLSRQVQTRLRTERQILATLDHPNIARLLDGGTTSDGTPYLVMEYVDGEPIDTYCNSRRLTIAARLQLFRTVCSSVHAAHRNLIVHRDLKPSNILVTADGTPKLLDFGIAKLLDVRQTPHTVAMTQIDVRIMTPDHASPEQVRGDSITTASDVYVLGVLLFELLTGERPFRSIGARLAEIERVICHEEPPLPSEVVARPRISLEAIERSAAERGTTPARLRRLLAGDLDNIVMMAMRKEPERRYASVETLSTDIDLHLRELPIVARADTWGYRTRKFVARHSLTVVAAGAFLVLLIGFAATTYLQNDRIIRERDIAAAQRTRAERVSTFLVDLFRRADPTEARGRDITASEILDRGARRVEGELAQEPETQATLLDAIGQVYVGLGQAERAFPLFERSLKLRRELLGDADPQTASSMRSLGEVELLRGELNKAEALLRGALNRQIAASGDRAETVAATMHTLGVLLRAKGEFDSADEMFRGSLERFTQLRGERDARVTEVMSDLASLAVNRGQYAEAERLYRRALAIDRDLLGSDHPQIAYDLGNLAMTLQMGGARTEPEPLYKESISIMERVLGSDHPEALAMVGNYARFLQIKGDLEGAEAVLRDALGGLQRVLGPAHPRVGYWKVSLALVLYERGKTAEAESLFVGALDVYKVALPPNHQYVASALTGLARIYADRGEVPRVSASIERAVNIWSKELPADHWQIANSRAVLGASLVNSREFARAEPILLQSHAQLARQRGAADPLTLRVSGWLVELYDGWGKPADADRYRVR